MRAQVLKKRFPGTLLVPDVCSVVTLPQESSRNSSFSVFGNNLGGSCTSDFLAEIKAILVVVQETEILAAGFPCIDVSRAGLRRGLDGQVNPTKPHRG